MAMFLNGHASPTTTQLAEGYTDEMIRSNYDNHRCSRPISQLSGTSLGSKVRLSLFSLTDDSMIGGAHKRVSCDVAGSRTAILAPKPQNTLGQLKYYYDNYHCRHFAPFLLLLFYAILGAWMFYLVEHENEKLLKKKEIVNLEKLRNGLVMDMAQLLKTNDYLKAREQLVIYEKELVKVKLPEGLAWDMWGALFYVGTIFTTIGYGNIVPRTMLGRSLTVLYAIIGIPLVLAILSNTGRQLTELVSRWWQRYRQHIKKAGRRARVKLSMAGKKNLDLERGETEQLAFDDEDDRKESSTIPVWLALLICVGWICFCAGLFLFWERRWTFFTSLYFFFISLSTIGLGDVVPDHPRLLILMFILVIIGLSIVSMLLSVIQIKIEEWLYNLMIKLQEEAQQALNQHRDMAEGSLLPKVMDKQSTLAKLFAPLLMTEKQTADVEQKAQQFERIVRETNNKNIQTEPPVQLTMGVQAQAIAQSISCDPMTSVHLVHGETQMSPRAEFAALRDISQDGDSVSDASSIPLDSVSVIERKTSEKLQKRVMFSESTCGGSPKMKDGTIQTDIAQFQIDEIMLRLFNLQKESVKPSLVEMGMETSICEDSIRQLTDKEILTEVLGVMSRSMETDQSIHADPVDQGINTVPLVTNSRGTFTSAPSLASKAVGGIPMEMVSFSTATEDLQLFDKSCGPSENSILGPAPRRDANCSPFLVEMVNRSSGSPNHNKLIEVSAETSQSEELLQRQDKMTSPIDRQLASGSFSASLSQEDRSLQTSMVADQADRSLQTSMINDEREEKSQQTSIMEVVDGGMQTSLTRDRSDESGEDLDRIMTDSLESRMFRSSHMDSGLLPRSTPAKQRGRSSSTSGLGNSVYDEDLRQEVIIQTDDSYLKIARRLDEFRSNKTVGLPVCAATPLTSRDEPNSPRERPSDRRGFFLESGGGGLPLRKRSTMRRRKAGRQDNVTVAAQTMQDLADQTESIKTEAEDSDTASDDNPLLVGPGSSGLQGVLSSNGGSPGQSTRVHFEA